MAGRIPDLRVDQMDFDAQLNRRRKRERLALSGFFVLATCVVVYLVLRPSAGTMFNWALALTAFVSWLGFFIVMLTMPRLRCTSCSARLDNLLERCCAECGEASLDSVSWFKTPRCRACGKSLWRGRGRGSWTIRFCSRCGVQLVGSTLPPNEPLQPTSGAARPS